MATATEAETKGNDSGGWVTGIMPKMDTQAAKFIQRFATYDGRGTVVGILDTGVDPGAEGLQITSDGKKKVIDLVDATSSGDVSMSKKVVLTDDQETVVGLSGRTLTLNRTKWKIRDNSIRLGIKAGYDIFPSGLKRRLKRERKKKWTESNYKLVNEAQAKVDEFKKEKDVDGNDQSEEEKAKTAKMLEDLELRVEQLRDLSDSTWEDLGPTYDCVVFHDGTNFRAVVDVSENGDLADLPCLTDYHKDISFQPLHLTMPA